MKAAMALSAASGFSSMRAGLLKMAVLLPGGVPTAGAAAATVSALQPLLALMPAALSRSVAPEQQGGLEARAVKQLVGRGASGFMLLGTAGPGALKPGCMPKPGPYQGGMALLAIGPYGGMNEPGPMGGSMGGNMGIGMLQAPELQRAPVAPGPLPAQAALHCIQDCNIICIHAAWAGMG